MNQDDVFRRIFKKTYDLMDRRGQWAVDRESFPGIYIESEEYKSFPIEIQKWLISSEGWDVYLKCVDCYNEKKYNEFEKLNPYPK